MKKKKTSLAFKAFSSFTISFIVFAYAKSDFLEYTDIKALQIFIALFATVIWSSIEDTSSKYED